MTKERIEIIRQSLIPFVKKELLDINYEGLGKSDAEEFEKDLNEVLDMAIKAQEQQTSDCKIFGTKENCFGGATENECNHCDYKIQALEQDTVSRETYTSEHFARKEAEYKLWELQQNVSEDCVSRQMVKEGMIKYGFSAPDMTVTEFIEDELPPVIPTHGTCKECKYSSVHTISLDKIDEIRVCRIQFSKQIKDDYYCANYEKRGNENEIN